MVGDGINDSAALATSDLGIAVSSATGIADISSDIVLTRDGLMTTVDALDLANRTRNNIRQNLLWAFAYNTPRYTHSHGRSYITHDLILPPWFAAVAMSLSSIYVFLTLLGFGGL